MIDIERTRKFVDQCWGDEIVPALIEYIRIPNKSPAFDPDWAAHGYMDEAVRLFERWARAKLADVPGAILEVVRLPGRTPVIVIDLPGQADDTVLLYGHLDKQPEMTGWADGYGPWIPRLEGDKLYGRGGADDGYAMFGALSALLALRDQSVPHARCVVLIEACEESGSYDLPVLCRPPCREARQSLPSDLSRFGLRQLRSAVADHIAARSGLRNPDREGARGRGPFGRCFGRRSVELSRVASPAVAARGRGDTGAIRPSELYAQIPPERVAQARRAAAALGSAVHTKFPFPPGTSPVTEDLTELVLNRTWRPQLAVTGIDGLPKPADAGNVLLPYTTAKLSLRLPPTLDAATAGAALRALLEKSPPYGAGVKFEVESSAAGWNAPALSPWLEHSLARSSQLAFGAPPAYMGEGGSIPFMAMLGEKFPQAQFVVTGVLGPHSNAHGPNEFLHIPTARRVSLVIAQILADHAARSDAV